MLAWLCGYASTSLRVVALGLLLSLSQPALASDEKRRFDIPPSSAQQALRLFAIQADIQLLFPYEDVKGLSLQGLAGEYVVEEAIRRLLAGTCLEAQPSGDAVIRIRENPGSRRFWFMRKTSCSKPEKSAGTASRNGPSTAGRAVPGMAAHSQTLEEMVVTAQKRAENAQKVPISLAALSGALIDSVEAMSLRDIDGAIPNVQISSFTNEPTSAVLHIRGVGLLEQDPFLGSAVSVVQDGVPEYFSFGALPDLFDIERIEVLRGPQGTLFGANTTGGVINVLTVQPSGEFGGTTEVTYGNYDRVDVKAAVDFPLVEGLLSGKVAGIRVSRRGYVENIVDGSDLGAVDVTGLRTYLMYTPAENVVATLTSQYGVAHGGGPFIAAGSVAGDLLYVREGTVAPGSESPMYASPCMPAGSRCQAPRSYKAANDSVPDRNRNRTRSTALTVEWGDTPFGDFTAISAFKDSSIDTYTDQDGTPNFYLDSRRETNGWQASQEIRTSYDVTSQTNMQIGAFYMRTHYDHFMNLRLEFAAPGHRHLNTQDQDNWSASLFGQVYVDVSDKLQLQGGLRVTREDTDMKVTGTDFFNPNGPAVFNGDIALDGFVARGSESWSEMGSKAGASYQFSEGVFLYASYARGFKSGGFSGRIVRPEDIGPFDPETVDAFEVGAKTDWLDGRLRGNLALFYSDYDHMQVAQNFLYENAQGQALAGASIFNATEAAIHGAELELSAQVLPSIRINGTFGYLDAEYDKFRFFDVVSGIERNLDGDRLQNAPEWTAVIGLSHATELASGELVTDIAYSYSASKYLQGLANQPISHIQPTELVNATVNWSPAAQRWQIGLWARNIFDKRYIASTLRNEGLDTLVSYAPPHEWGVSVKLDF